MYLGFETLSSPNNIFKPSPLNIFFKKRKEKNASNLLLSNVFRLSLSFKVLQWSKLSISYITLENQLSENGYPVEETNHIIQLNTEILIK